MIFSIAMGADYLSYVNSIATYAPAFLGYNDLVLARVLNIYHKNHPHTPPDTHVNQMENPKNAEDMK